MSKAYVFFNPNAGNGQCEKDVRSLIIVVRDELIFCDMTDTDTYIKTLHSMRADDYLIICGGDGTLNRFLNYTADMKITNKILYYPSGSGNDFARDLEHKYGDEPFEITEYIRTLPTVTVNGKTRYFINGIGFGIDGYCCEEGDMLKAAGKKDINYASIAVKGLLLHFKPRRAVVTVDGVAHTYKNVWLAPTMFGRYYGGGMMPTPQQSRKVLPRKLSVMVWHGACKLRTLAVFPLIFKGRHITHKKLVDIYQGNDITVTFDLPTALQIDGETIPGVTTYKVSHYKQNTALKQNKESDIAAPALK